MHQKQPPAKYALAKTGESAACPAGDRKEKAPMTARTKHAATHRDVIMRFLSPSVVPYKPTLHEFYGSRD